MRLVFFGLTLSSSWANGHATPYRALLSGLRQLGHECVFFERDTPYYAKHRDFSACDYAELVIYADWGAVRERALREAAGADIVITASFLENGAHINDELANVTGPVRAYYDLDTPITLAKWSAEQSVGYIRPEQIPNFDLVLSFTGGKSLASLRETYGAKHALPLYGCVDADVHRSHAVPENYRCALSYMGTYAADRQEKVERLFFDVARGMPEQRFLLAGAMYPWGMPISRNVRHFPHVSPDDHWAIYSGSRASLNLTREIMAANGYCPSGRLFEAAACGAPVISDRWAGIDEFFIDGEEIIIADTTDDVLRALKRCDEDLRGIAKRAREKTLDLHTGIARARELVTAVESSRAKNLAGAAA